MGVTVVEARHQHFSVEIYDVRIRPDKCLGGLIRSNKYDLATADGNGLGPRMTFICSVDGAANKDPVSAGRPGSATGWQHSDQYNGNEDVEMISIHCRITLPQAVSLAEIGCTSSIVTTTQMVRS
jgi:hypothetical protein